MRELADAREPVHIDKGGVHHFVPRPGDARFGGRPVDLSALSEVLEVDAEARTCTAEPGATFAAVVRATLAHGLLPKVVPELEGITVGGAVAGCSVESMSHRYGGFHDGCVEYEVVTGTGERRALGPEDDLFHMLHGSYGTLAILTRVRFELIPAKPYVTLTYRRHSDFEAFDADMRERCRTGDFDFVDGIIHAPDELVLCLGRFADSVPHTSDYRATGGVYYRSTRVLAEDHLSTPDYLFRYDTEAHWLSRTVKPLEWRPVRRLVGRWILGSTNLIRWSNRLGPLLGRVMRRPDVVVDVFIPLRRFGDFWRWYERDFAYWPLWIVPYRVPEMYPWVAAGARGQAGRRADDRLRGVRQAQCEALGRLVAGARGEDSRAGRHQDPDLSQPLHARALLGDLRPQAVGGGQGRPRSRRAVQRPVREVRARRGVRRPKAALSDRRSGDRLADPLAALELALLRGALRLRAELALDFAVLPSCVCGTTSGLFERARVHVAWAAASAIWPRPTGAVAVPSARRRPPGALLEPRGVQTAACPPSC